MKHIVVDLEMNSLAKEFKEEKILCGREIIEIGAVVLDEQYHEIGSFKTLVKPQYNDVIKPYFDGYNEEIGIVGQLSEITAEPNESAYRIGMDELPEAAGLVAADEGIGVPYGYDSLLKQYTERMEEDFGRNYLLRGGVDNSIACHVATYAETPKIAVIGGVITSPEFRGKGVSKGVLAKLCRDLKEEGKDVFSFYYIPAAKAMHEGVGFKTKVVWAKLFK